MYKLLVELSLVGNICRLLRESEGLEALLKTLACGNRYRGIRPIRRAMTPSVRSSDEVPIRAAHPCEIARRACHSRGVGLPFMSIRRL